MADTNNARDKPEEVQHILISQIHPFPEHPFQVRDDELMQQTIDSIQQVGILTPVILRPDESGEYEMISGHRRLYAAGLAGLETIPANNMHDVDTWMFFKWIFKTACAVLIVTNTWNIVMGVFDVAQSVISNASGVVVGNVNIDIASHFADLEARLTEMGIGELLGLWLQSFIVGVSMWFLSICIFIIAYGRMIEIYLVTSVAPIPMATMANREWGQMGTNYLRNLFALGFQGFLIIVCVAIYAVLVQNMIVDTNISTAIWSCMGYTVLLCFTLFKTGSLAKSVFNAH